MGNGDQVVRDQYECYAHPACNQEDEIHRLVGGSSSLILEIEHFLIFPRAKRVLQEL